MHVDSETGPGPLVAAWHAVGRRVATAVGAATALLSLFVDTPVHVASLRGAVAWGSVLALTRVGAWVLVRTWSPPADDHDPADETPTTETASDGARNRPAA